MHQSIPAPPIPKATAGHLGALSVPGGGGGICQFCAVLPAQGPPLNFCHADGFL